MKNQLLKKFNILYSLGVMLGVVVLATSSAQAQTAEFNNEDGNDLYGDALNWSTSAVPDLSIGETAQIDDGAAVDLESGSVPISGDLNVANGGELEITNGSFTQSDGGAYIDLGRPYDGETTTGNGTILVDGGTFNQGTDGANPFAVEGTGNVFSITSGAANFTSSFNSESGLTYNQSGGTTTIGGAINAAGGSAFNVTGGAMTTGGGIAVASGATFSVGGGTVTVAGSIGTATGSSFNISGGTVTQTSGEFDFNNTTDIMSGGTLNTSLITGVNGTNALFTFSGGTINTSSSTGIYTNNAIQVINFTLGSTGMISFNGGTSVSSIEGFISSGVVEFNGTTDDSAFTGVMIGGVGAAESSDFLIVPGATTLDDGSPVTSEILELNPTLVPEPSTYLMLGLGLLALVGFRKRFSVLG